MVVSFASNRFNDNDIDTLIDKVKQAASANGLNLPNPCGEISGLNFRHKSQLKDDIRKWIDKYGNLKFMLVFIPDDDELYNALKYLTEVEFGILTQCVSQGKSRKFSDMSYAGNLVLKINSKLGGTNCILQQRGKNF